VRERFFGWGSIKLYDFSVGEAKIGGKLPRQSNSKYNFMQYAFVEKVICSVQWGLRPSARSWGILENFCSKVTEKWGSRMY